MRRLLKLHHRKHTGKLIHHRHTSYRALFLLVLVTGFLIIFTQHVAHADDVFVTATVPAPIPSGAPTFTSPDDNTTTDNPEVTFTGTCPVITPAIIIALYDNSNLIGSGVCQADGTFSILVQLSAGPHTIVATVVTITNQTGQSSHPLHITYTPPTAVVVPPKPDPSPGASPSQPSTPATPSSPTTTPSGSTDGNKPLQIISDQAFVTFGAGVAARWQGHFEGGDGPYKIVIDWGDGHTTTQEGIGTEAKTYEHKSYTNGQYTLSITMTDQSGHSLTRYYAVINLSPRSNATGIGITSITDFSQTPMMTILGLYIALFLLVVLMWWYEHTHHRQRVGVAIHYPWQKESK